MLADLLILATPFLGAGAFLVWMRRRKAGRPPKRAMQSGPPKEETPILMMLLKTPRVVSEGHLQMAVREAFGRDVVIAENDHAQEGVLARGAVGMVQFDGYALSTYSDFNAMKIDPDRITELRLRSAFRAHRGILSVGCIHRPDDAKRADAYDRIGKLMAALVDESALAVYSPELGRANVINDETIEGLRSGDPLAMLKTATTDGISQVSGEDPRMMAATEEARRRWPEFVAAFESSTEKRDLFMVKAPFTDGFNTEFMWVRTESIAAERLSGILLNDPFNVRGYRKDAKVEVPVTKIVDWAYPGEDGPIGLFTEAIVREAMRG